MSVDLKKPSIKTKFSGEVHFSFLGQDYIMMKPSMEHDVYVLLSPPPPENVADKPGNKGELATLMDDPALKEVTGPAEKGKSFLDKFEYIKITDLAFARFDTLQLIDEKPVSAWLLKIGIDIKLKSGAARLGGFFEAKQLKVSLLRNLDGEYMQTWKDTNSAYVQAYEAKNSKLPEVEQVSIDQSMTVDGMSKIALLDFKHTVGEAVKVKREMLAILEEAKKLEPGAQQKQLTS